MGALTHFGRLCKYPLLLGEMRKHCGEHQKEGLAQAIEKVKAFVADVNVRLLKDEDMEPLYEIQDSLYPSLSGVCLSPPTQRRRIVYASVRDIYLERARERDRESE